MAFRASLRTSLRKFAVSSEYVNNRSSTLCTFALSISGSRSSRCFKISISRLIICSKSIAPLIFLSEVGSTKLLDIDIASAATNLDVPSASVADVEDLPGQRGKFGLFKSMSSFISYYPIFSSNCLFELECAFFMVARMSGACIWELGEKNAKI